MRSRNANWMLFITWSSHIERLLQSVSKTCFCWVALYYNSPFSLVSNFKFAEPLLLIQTTFNLLNFRQLRNSWLLMMLWRVGRFVNGQCRIRTRFKNTFSLVHNFIDLHIYELHSCFDLIDLLMWVIWWVIIVISCSCFTSVQHFVVIARQRIVLNFEVWRGRWIVRLWAEPI